MPVIYRPVIKGP